MTESELKELIEQTAKKYGVSAEKITEEIQKSINSAYKNPNSFALSVPKKNDIPTMQEIIKFFMRNMKN